jgi:hypothetical protein
VTAGGNLLELQVCNSLGCASRGVLVQPQPREEPRVTAPQLAITRTRTRTRAGVRVCVRARVLPDYSATGRVIPVIRSWAWVRGQRVVSRRATYCLAVGRRRLRVRTSLTLWVTTLSGVSSSRVLRVVM